MNKWSFNWTNESFLKLNLKSDFYERNVVLSSCCCSLSWLQDKLREDHRYLNSYIARPTADQWENIRGSARMSGRRVRETWHSSNALEWKKIKIQSVVLRQQKRINRRSLIYRQFYLIVNFSPPTFHFHSDFGTTSIDFIFTNRIFLAASEIRYERKWKWQDYLLHALH